MQQETVIAGAWPSIWEENEQSYGQIATKRLTHLPSIGGVGKIPLVIHHQHQLPSCTGEAGAYSRMITYYQKTGKMVDLSAMFIYKMNRLFDGLAPGTKGSTLKATMQSLQAKGVCRERLYRSNAETCQRPFPSIRQGGQVLLSDAVPYRIGDYARCEGLNDILLALYDQHPVAFSLIIYTDFYLADRGLVSADIHGEKIGGHSMVAMNYDLDTELIEVVQSWGNSSDGPTDRGYMYIPFSWFQAKTGQTPLLIEAFTLL